MRDLIILNASHYRGGNRYTLKLGQGNQFKKGTKVSLDTFSMYNSTYNISAELMNNWVSYRWIDNTVYTWTIPDGYYSIEDLSVWLNGKMLEANLYVDTSDNQRTVYFTRFLPNAPLYRAQIDIFFVPSLSQASSFGYVKPSSATWNFQSTAVLPQLTIAPNLKKFFGFSTRETFGNESVIRNYEYLGDIRPRVSDVFAIAISCNFVSTNFNVVRDVLTHISINKPFGSLIEYKAQTDSFTEKFVDEDLLICLAIETPDE